MRPQPFAIVPDSGLTQLRWKTGDGLILRVERGVPQLLKQLDQEWLGLAPEQDPVPEWRFYEFAREPHRKERYVVVDSSGRCMAVWLDHDRSVCGDAYRLDYFKVRPDAFRHGVGVLALGMIAERALEFGAARVVFQPIASSEAFYRGPRVGAEQCPDWKGGHSLPNLQLSPSSIIRLTENLRAFQV